MIWAFFVYKVGLWLSVSLSVKQREFAACILKKQEEEIRLVNQIVKIGI